MDMKDIKIRLHYILPKHLITRLVGFLATAHLGKFTTWLIKQFIEIYHINTNEMSGKIEDFASFNDFFSRALKKGARPIDKQNGSIVFPSDGTIGEYGKIIENLQMQAKGHYFTTDALLGSTEDAKTFQDGHFCTIYLSPSDYHRVHIPYSGKLLKMTHIAGELFSVNPTYVENIPELFSRNERVVCLFETDLGKMAVILVGATIVRSVSTIWHGIVTSDGHSPITTFSYARKNISFAKGEEIGKFLMGSTVICLFEKDMVELSAQLKSGTHIHMGIPMAKSLPQKKTSKSIKRNAK